MDEEMKEGKEKYWNELNETEKIERMRHQVKSLQKQLKSVQHTTYLLMNHRHNEKVGLLVPFGSKDAPYPWGEGSAMYEDDVYF